MQEQMTKPKSEEGVLHYPNLRTVLLVEETIKDLGTTTKTNLFRTLRNRVMWQKMETILDYLQARGMIAFDKEGKVVWVYSPELVRKYVEKKHLRIRL